MALRLNHEKGTKVRNQILWLISKLISLVGIFSVKIKRIERGVFCDGTSLAPVEAS